MVVFPNAKINIGLNIIGRRKDGYHNLESVFYPVNWLDILEINESNKFKFTSSGLLIDASSENNLVVKAYNLLKTKFPHKIKPCHIHLHKQIPMGAGLGGGSADASYTLATLNQMFDLGLTNKQLEELADSLGSDCAFFIENTPKFVTGKGEVLTPIELSLKGKYIKLVNPKIHISTKEAFANLKPVDKKLNIDLISNNHVTEWQNQIVNDFEKSVFPNHPEIEDIKIKLQKESALYVSMTGTGSTVYGLYDTEPKPSFPHFSEKIIELS